MSDFNGKSIIVTGGGLGMGLACARRFAAGGGKVMIVANDKASVDSAVAEIGENAAGFVGDVRRNDDMAAAVQTAASRHGGVDVLACCAGIQRYGTVVDTPEEVWDDVLDINLKGIFLASKFAIPEMRKRGGGAIVAISSVQAYASQAGVAAYTASKGAINALVRAMALDMPGTISRSTPCAPPPSILRCCTGPLISGRVTVPPRRRSMPGAEGIHSAA